MRKISIVFLQLFLAFVCFILPMVFFFLSYANHVTSLAIESGKTNAENNLHYVKSTFDLLTESVRTEAVRISSSNDYITAVKDVMEYDQIVADVSVQEEIAKVISRLATVQFADERLRNVYLYSLDTDYVLTSDRGLLRLSAMEDNEWLKEYLTSNNEGVTRSPMWIFRITPESDLLSNGSKDNTTPVISYIMPVRISNSSRLSLLVLNFYETKIASLINVDSHNTVYIMDGDTGKIICHPDQVMLGTCFVYQSMMENGDEELVGSYMDGSFNYLSYMFHPQNLTLYSYLISDINHWVFINENAMLPFMDSVAQLARNYLIVMAISLLLCVIFYTLGTRFLFQPIKKIVARFITPQKSVRNEIFLIQKQIYQMELHERALIENLRHSHDDVKKLYLISLFRDRPWRQEIPIQWLYSGFIVVILELDSINNCGYLNENEQQVFILLDESIKIFATDFYCEGVATNDRSGVLVLNLPSETPESCTQIHKKIAQVRENLRQRIGGSFTAGVGFFQQGEHGIYESYHQAITASRQRLLQGYAQTIVYDQTMSYARMNYYPKKIEMMLLNAIAAANTQAVDDALELLHDKLSELDVDNILHTMKQFSCSIASWLMENYQVNEVFDGGIQDWYLEEKGAETLDKLLMLLRQRALTIVSYLEEKNKVDYVERLMKYILEHYTEDIDFDQMAGETGISYSYARRIVKGARNQSLLDMVHETRIREAKRLLREVPLLSIKEVAAKVGYHNIQSFNRFFKRFEGITPSEFRIH